MVVDDVLFASSRTMQGMGRYEPVAADLAVSTGLFTVRCGKREGNRLRSISKGEWPHNG